MTNQTEQPNKPETDDNNKIYRHWLYLKIGLGVAAAIVTYTVMDQARPDESETNKQQHPETIFEGDVPQPMK